MSSLSDLREELANDLRDAGYHVYDYLPSQFAPPLIVVGAGDPYLTNGDVFDSVTVHLEIIILTGTATNAVVTKKMDRMVTDTFLNMSSKWGLDEVSGPFMASVNTTQYMACKLLVSQIIKLEVEA